MYASNYSFIATSSSSMASTQHPRDIKIQECVFRAVRKTKMTALSESEWLRYIRLSLRITEFDQTGQEASAQCLLQVSLCFSDQSKNKDDHPSDWLRDFQLLLFNRLRNGIWRNLTWSKYSMSSTKFLGCVFFSVCVCVCFFFFFFGGGGGVLTGIHGKQICTSCQLYGMPYLLWFPNCVARFKALPYFILGSKRVVFEGGSRGPPPELFLAVFIQNGAILCNNDWYVY